MSGNEHKPEDKAGGIILATIVTAVIIIILVVVVMHQIHKHDKRICVVRALYAAESYGEGIGIYRSMLALSTNNSTVNFEIYKKKFLARYTETKEKINKEAENEYPRIVMAGLNIIKQQARKKHNKDFNLNKEPQ